MQQGNPDLAALIGSRICHDLISPIGAITNGLELLNMAGTPGGPELSLIADSVEHAGARIRFFRIAYGAADDTLLGPAEVAGILADMTEGGRLKVRWLPEQPTPRDRVRLVFLALQCCETALAFGGDIRIEAQDDAWIVEAQAEKLKLDAALWGDLATGTRTVPITPALVQFALLPIHVSEAGLRLDVAWSDRHVRLRF